MIARIRSKREEVRQFHDDFNAKWEFERANEISEQHKLDENGSKTGRIASKKLYLNDELLEWYSQQAETVDLSRNQLIFWILRQWKARLEHDGSDMDCPPRLPAEHEVDGIQDDLKRSAHEQCRDINSRYIRLVDEFGGDLGTVNHYGMGLDGSIE